MTGVTALTGIDATASQSWASVVTAAVDPAIEVVLDDQKIEGPKEGPVKVPRCAEKTGVVLFMLRKARRVTVQSEH